MTPRCLPKQDGSTLLHRAVSLGGDLELAALLLDRGADVHLEDAVRTQHASAGFAVCRTRAGALRGLRYAPHCARPATRLGSPASGRGSFAPGARCVGAQLAFALQTLWKRFWALTRPFRPRQSRETPLHKAAALGGSAASALLLLDRGAPAHGGPSAGGAAGSALATAVWSGNAEVLRLLLQRGAPVDEADAEGFTLLHEASRKGNAAAATALLEAGAAVNGRSKDGTTPLLLAATLGRADVVRALLERHADVALVGSDGAMTALHLAASFGHADVARALLLAGASLKAATRDGHTPLHLAAWGAHAECVRLLLAAGADVAAVTHAGYTPLHEAARKGHAECARALLGAGADAQAATKAGKTAAQLVPADDPDTAALLGRGEGSVRGVARASEAPA
jgi:ankyrin repeat protein